MPDKYNIDAARKEGYSDDEIVDFLDKQHNLGLGKARKEGYSSREVLDYLANPASAQVSPQLTQKDVEAYGKVPVPAGSPYHAPGKSKPAPVPGLNAPTDSGWRNPWEATKVLADTAFIQGPSNVLGGVTQVFSSPKHPEDTVNLGIARPAREQVQGTARVLKGTGEALIPLLPFAGAAALRSVPAAIELAAGLAAPHVVSASMEAAGADPDLTEVVAGAAGLLPVAQGARAAGKAIRRQTSVGTVADAAMKNAFTEPGSGATAGATVPPAGAGPTVSTTPPPPSPPGLIDKVKLAYQSAKTSIPFRTQENLKSLENQWTPEVPPPEPGMKRLYRVDETAKGKGLPTWMEGDPKAAAVKQASGRWFTEDPADIEFYSRNNKAPKVTYLDLPEADAAKFKVANYVAKGDINPKAYSARPDTEYFLPPEVVPSRKPFRTPQDIQQAVRQAAPSVARTQAAHIIQEDLPRINELMRSTGLRDAERMFPEALIDARLEAIEQQNRAHAQSYRETPLDTIATKRSKLEEHAEFLDQEFPNMKLADKLKEIREGTAGNDANFAGWVEDNFHLRDGLLYRKGTGESTPGLSLNRARELWDAEIQAVAPKLAKDMYHLEEAGGHPQPGVDVLFQATDAVGKAIRARDLLVRTHEALAQAIFRNRHREQGFDEGGQPRWINQLEQKYGRTPDEIAELPQFQQALEIYKREGGIEHMFRGSHLERGGQESALGRHGTYYPLIKPQEEGLTGLVSRFTERTKRIMTQKNPNQYASGLLSEYSTKPADLSKALHSAILQKDTSVARDVLSQRPDLFRKLGAGEPMPQGWATVYTEPGVTTWKDPVGAGLPRYKSSSAPTPWIAPKQLADELRVLWDKSPYDPDTAIPPQHIEALANTLTSAGIMTNLYGPADNMMFAMRLLTVPGTQRPALPGGIAHNLVSHIPLAGMAVASARAGKRILSFDASDPAVRQDLTQMIQEGVMHPRYGRIATARRAADTGVEAVRPVDLRGPVKAVKSVAGRSLDEFDRFVYGREGLDVRVRWDLWKAHKEAYPDARPAERARFVNQIANYNRELTSQVERTVQENYPALAPFFATGYGALTGGMRAATGYHALPDTVTPADRLTSITRSQMASGLTGYLVSWAGANKALNGQYPWEDPEGAKVGAIKLPADLVAKLAPVIGTPQGKAVYVDALKFPYMLADKGGKALGITGALDEALDQQRGRVRGPGGLADAVAKTIVPLNAGTTKMFLDGTVRGLINSWTQPFTMGPVSGAMSGVLGVTPYLQSLAPPEGLSLLSSRPRPLKSSPESRSLTDRVSNLFRPSSAVGEVGAAALRGASGFFGMEGLPNAVGARESGFGELDTSQVNPAVRTGVGAAKALGIIPRQFAPYTGNPAGRGKRGQQDIKRLEKEYMRNR